MLLARTALVIAFVSAGFAAAWLFMSGSGSRSDEWGASASSDEVVQLVTAEVAENPNGL